MWQVLHHLRGTVWPFTSTVFCMAALAAASASSMTVFRGMMPGSVVAVRIKQSRVEAYNAAPIAVTTEGILGETYTQKQTQVDVSTIQAKAVTEKSGPTMHLPSQQKVCLPCQFCHTLVCCSLAMCRGMAMLSRYLDLLDVPPLQVALVGPACGAATLFDLESLEL